MRRGQGAKVGIEGGLVGFDGEQVVGLLVLDQEAGGFALGVQGIGGHHPPGQIQGFEKGFERWDLVGFGGDLARCDGDTLPLEESAESMHLGGVGTDRPAQGLAVDGHRIVGVGHTEQPVAEAGIDGRHIAGLQDAAQCRLGRRLEASGTGVEAGAQALELGLGQVRGPLGDGRIAASAGEHGGDAQHGPLAMAQATRPAAIGQGIEALLQILHLSAGQGNRLHGGTPGGGERGGA